MPVKEKVLVTGATGKLGRELVRRLLDYDVEVTAATRKPEDARALFGAGVDIVELDYERTETYDAAVMWADRVFLMAPPFDPETDETLVPFLDWAVSSGSDHIVLLSAMGIETLDQLALRKVERRIEQIGVPYTILRPNWYMQNCTTGFLARSIRETGSFSLSAGAGEVSFIDVRDVAAAAAVVLTGDDHFGTAYTLTGPDSLSHAAAARVFSAAAGRTITYEPVSDDRMRAVLREEGWDDAHTEVFLGLMRAIEKGARSGVSPDVEMLLGRAPTSLVDFAEEHAGAWQAATPA